MLSRKRFNLSTKQPKPLANVPTKRPPKQLVPSEPVQVPEESSHVRSEVRDSSVQVMSVLKESEPCLFCGKDLSVFRSVMAKEAHMNECLDSKAIADRSKVGDVAETDEDFLCMICTKDLTLYTLRQRESHINRCADSTSSSSRSCSSVCDEDDECLVNRVVSCPCCLHGWADLNATSLKARQLHIKRCAREQSMKIATVLDLLVSMEQQSPHKVETDYRQPNNSRTSGTRKKMVNVPVIPKKLPNNSADDGDSDFGPEQEFKLPPMKQSAAKLKEDLAVVKAMEQSLKQLAHSRKKKSSKSVQQALPVLEARKQILISLANQLTRITPETNETCAFYCYSALPSSLWNLASGISADAFRSKALAEFDTSVEKALGDMSLSIESDDAAVEDLKVAVERRTREVLKQIDALIAQHRAWIDGNVPPSSTLAQADENSATCKVSRGQLALEFIKQDAELHQKFLLYEPVTASELLSKFREDETIAGISKVILRSVAEDKGLHMLMDQ